MENKKFELLNENELEAVSGGTDALPHMECTDFVCWCCGYKKKDLTDRTHKCTYADALPNRCDNCVHLGSCERSHAFIDVYYG